MATNEIKQFATSDIGTNLLTQEEYEADSQLAQGHQPGIARSKLANKLGRQLSTVAAAVAQFVADNQGTNVTDSLSASSLATMIGNAIKAYFPSASTTVQGKVELATDAETQTGTDTARAVTPAALAARTATTTRTGVVELATQTETNTGTDGTRAVTPSTLAGRTATTSRAGVIEIATTAEIAAEDSTRAMVGSAFKGLFSWSLTNPGYYKLPSLLGGLIVQWGSQSDDGVLRNFVEPFPNAVFALVATSDSGAVKYQTLSTTQYQLLEGSGTSGGVTIKWIAVGY